ncbi:ABC transporter ATP-binding protein [Lacrimispora amygdalina]|uniref:ABC transporter ATP-binding protein n=1 Tax=Lacrimispora amygdalina TaxID=253257 RepID=A0A3E2N547_9FIRM|nr:ABC transporter ATP-binding protein [Clostridium indicum]RFZ76096.1 ABC transporter ATP-binding protein [Clostridium indicum]
MTELIGLKRELNFSFKKYIFRYIKCFIFMLGYTITSVIFPGLVSLVMDKGVMVGDYHSTIVYISIFLIIGIMMTIFQYLERLSFFKLSQDILIYIKIIVFRKIMDTNLAFWNNHKIGDVMSVVESDISRIESLLTTKLCDAIVNIFVIIGMSIFLIYLNIKIGGLLILIAFIFVAIQRKLGIFIKNNMLILRKSLGDNSSLLNEILNNIQNIQIIGLVVPFIDKYKVSIDNIKDNNIKNTNIVSLSLGVSNLYVIISMLIVLFVGSIEYFRGHLTIGIVLTFLLYAQRLYSPISSICNTFVSIKNISPSISKILDILKNENIIYGGNYYPVTDIQGSLELRAISFKYQLNPDYVFKDFNLKINSGEIIGIIGKNGSGKTTIIKLLAGLCVPEQGIITIDGVDLKKYDLEYLRRQIGYVLQSNYLVSGKLKDILRFGVENEFIDIKDEMIKSFELNISKFSNGWETYINEKSMNISGGELQKISLIRLFSSPKQMYILDEPTSFMDNESEKKVCSKMEELLNNKTAIIITHRPQILHICNRVIDLDAL